MSVDRRHIHHGDARNDARCTEHDPESRPTDDSERGHGLKVDVVVAPADVSLDYRLVEHDDRRMPSGDLAGTLRLRSAALRAEAAVLAAICDRHPTPQAWTVASYATLQIRGPDVTSVLSAVLGEDVVRQITAEGRSTDR